MDRDVASRSSTDTPNAGPGRTLSNEAKLCWVPPRVDALPPLAKLTLITPEVSEDDLVGDGIQGNMSSVFPDPY